MAVSEKEIEAAAEVIHDNVMITQGLPKYKDTKNKQEKLEAIYTAKAALEAAEKVREKANSGNHEIKIKVLNKYLALVIYGNRSPRMEANPFELAKQCLLYEQKAKNLPLPRFGLDLYHFENNYPDLINWWEHSYVVPAEILETLDFSKPYDDNLVAKYKPAKSKKVKMNADDFINAELEATND